MKTYRLENDAKWNYGIRLERDWATLTGRVITIFCFKQDRLRYLGECFSIDHGFWFDFVWAFKIRTEIWKRWQFRTKKIYKYSRMSAKR
jgi:hypothetical protein